jgi:hypothetical protein
MCQKLLKTRLPPYSCYSFSICVELCKFDSVGEKLLQHIFREYEYILVIIIAFKVVSFILFLTFVLTLFITENNNTPTYWKGEHS